LASLRNEVAATDDDPQRAQRIQNLISTAVQLAQRATQGAPNEAVNWANLGRVYRTLVGVVEDVESLSEDAFTKAAELRPGDPTFDNEAGQMWLARAELSRQNERVAALAKAEAAFKRAIEKSPTFGLAIYNLGAVYDRQGRVPEAIRQLEQLVPANPNEPNLVFELGLLYARNDRFDDAIAAMRRAVLLAPQFANARWYLALLLEERDDVLGALVQLKEIEKNNPDNETLKQKIAQLEAQPPVAPEGEVIDTRPLQ
jgi:tetratricopeptide (TPR) repeat protein